MSCAVLRFLVLASIVSNGLTTNNLRGASSIAEAPGLHNNTAMENKKVLRIQEALSESEDDLSESKESKHDCNEGLPEVEKSIVVLKRKLRKLYKAHGKAAAKKKKKLHQDPQVLQAKINDLVKFATDLQTDLDVIGECKRTTQAAEAYVQFDEPIDQFQRTIQNVLRQGKCVQRLEESEEVYLDIAPHLTGLDPELKAKLLQPVNGVLGKLKRCSSIVDPSAKAAVREIKQLTATFGFVKDLAELRTIGNLQSQRQVDQWLKECEEIYSSIKPQLPSLHNNPKLKAALLQLVNGVLSNLERISPRNQKTEEIVDSSAKAAIKKIKGLTIKFKKIKAAVKKIKAAVKQPVKQPYVQFDEQTDHSQRTIQNVLRKAEPALCVKWLEYSEQLYSSIEPNLPNLPGLYKDPESRAKLVQQVNDVLAPLQHCYDIIDEISEESVIGEIKGLRASFGLLKDILRRLKW